MMRDVGITLISAGLLSEAARTELRRWGIHAVEVEQGKILDNVDDIVSLIERVISSGEFVETRDTDLDIVRLWLRPDNQREGRLTVGDGTNSSTFKITYCKTVLGEYVIPWRGEAIYELMLSANTWLREALSGTEENKRVQFTAVKEIYIDDKKTFMVCAAR